MKLSFRWYGEDDKVTLENIRQIPGMQSIVTAVYDVPVGEVWSRESIAKLKKQVEDAGLGFDVIESIPVHEDISWARLPGTSTSRTTVRTSAVLRRQVLNVSATISCLYLTGHAILHLSS